MAIEQRMDMDARPDVNTKVPYVLPDGAVIFLTFYRGEAARLAVPVLLPGSRRAVTAVRLLCSVEGGVA